MNMKCEPISKVRHEMFTFATQDPKGNRPAMLACHYQTWKEAPMSAPFEHCRVMYLRFVVL